MRTILAKLITCGITTLNSKLDFRPPHNKEVIFNKMSTTNNFKMLRLFFLVTVGFASNANAFKWLDSLTEGAQVVTCMNDVIHLPFNFTLSPEERVLETKWTFSQAEGRADEDIAIYAGGHFVIMPAFSGRVQSLGDGGISVSKAGILESGNYSVEVTVEFSGGHSINRHYRTAFVSVVDAPQTVDGSLHVHQTPHAVYDASSGQWRIQLTCGKIQSLGKPPVHVVWTAPDGQTIPSSSGPDNGTFSLLLPNPPTGGNFTCSLPPPSLSPATKCLPPLSPLLGGASVVVDQVKVTFVLLEAMMDKTKDLQRQLDAKTTELKDLKNQTSSELTALKNETAYLRTSLGKLSTKISFHARLTNTFTGSGQLKPFTILRSEGQGFDATNGQFRVPMNGTYFFVGSSSTYGANQLLFFKLYVDSVLMCYTYADQSGSTGDDVAGSVHAVLHVQEGQLVWLQSSGGYYYYETTFFSGFLLDPDL